VYCASFGGVEIRLRVDPEAAWIVIRGPGTESRYFDIPDDQVGSVTAFFPSEGDSPERFQAFVSTIEAQFAAATTP
jgi:hypothetical protein